MHTFKDCHGNEWKIELTIATAMDVRDALNIDLLQPEQGDPPLLTRIGTDELLLAEIILRLIQEQMDAKGMDDRKVRSAFDGSTILAAQKAFYEELVVFFRLRGREDRARAVEKQCEMILKAIELQASQISNIQVDKILNQSGNSSGSLPGLSE